MVNKTVTAVFDDAKTSVAVISEALGKNGFSVEGEPEVLQ